MGIIAALALVVLAVLLIGVFSAGKRFSDEDDRHTHHF